MALLDEILSPEWEYRLYSFDPAWAPGAEMASMRNGSGDDCFIGFSAAGVLIKGFGHESPMSPYRTGDEGTLWPGLFDDVPESLHAFRDEPAFNPADTTFCIWAEADEARWCCGVHNFAPGDDPDGSASLLRCFDGRPETYAAQARDYFERDISIDVVRHVFEHRPLTAELVETLNPDASLDDLMQAATASRYGL